MGITVFALLTVMSLMEPQDCSAYSQVLEIQWGMLVVMFLASVAVVAVVTRKVVPGVAGRLAVVASHGVVTLASYVIIAFGLMVAFNW